VGASQKTHLIFQSDNHPRLSNFVASRRHSFHNTQLFDKHMPTRLQLFDYQMLHTFLHGFDYQATKPRTKKDRQQSKNPLYNPFIQVYSEYRQEKSIL